jgi:hypothetical protein
VTSHGGILELSKTIGHVEWQLQRSPKGFTPSNAKPNLTLQALTTNFGQVVEMCFQVIEFVTLLIKLYALARSFCYVINFANDLHLYIHTSYDIKGKC